MHNQKKNETTREIKYILHCEKIVQSKKSRVSMDISRRISWINREALKKKVDFLQIATFCMKRQRWKHKTTRSLNTERINNQDNGCGVPAVSDRLHDYGDLCSQSKPHFIRIVEPWPTNAKPFFEQTGLPFKRRPRQSSWRQSTKDEDEFPVKNLPQKLGEGRSVVH